MLCVGDVFVYFGFGDVVEECDLGDYGLFCLWGVEC